MRIRAAAFVDVGVALAVLTAATPARANGAFPDSQSILTPEDRPAEIVLVTNFGLISSTDDGKTWLWSCEQDGNALGAFYQLTPAPRNRLITVANQRLAYSDDASCGWATAGGAIVGQSITDAYLDPVSGTRVLAVAASDLGYSVYQSTDAGSTFAPAMYQAAPGATIGGVEIARSDANVVYIAQQSADGTPQLARSSDGGVHFTIHDLGADLGPGQLRIIAIDPVDPNRVLLRFLGAGAQSLALTIDGGASATKPVTVNGNFNAYVRLSTGTILVAGVVDYSTTPALFRSRDQGTSFEMVPHPPSLRALSQRGGRVFGAADNFGDGYAIGTSDDEGTTWQALITYANVNAINPCLKAACQSVCVAEVGMSLWSTDVCTAAAPASNGAGGVGGGSAAMAGHDGQMGAAGATGAKPPAVSGGGCDVAQGASGRWSAALLLLVVMACRGRCPRARASRDR